MPRPRLVSRLSLAVLVFSSLASPGLARADEPAVQQLTLAQALDRLHSDAPTADELAGRVAEARAQVQLATAPLQPVLAVQGGYTRNSDEAVISLATVIQQLAESLSANVELDPAQLPPDITIQPLDQWTAGASLRVPILEPAAWADLGAARQAAAATEAGAEAAWLQAEAGLVKAAWLVTAADQAVAARQHGVDAARAHRDSAERRAEAGIGTSLDVLQAEVELVRRQSELVQATAERDQARRALGSLLGLPGPVSIAVPPLPGAATAATAAPAETHPEVVAAEAMLRAARRQVSGAWWRHSPTLEADAKAFATDVELVTGEKQGWQVGLQATWVLYDGGARYGLLSRARARELQARAQATRARLDLDRQQRDATQAVEVARERLRLAEQGVATAAEAEATAGRLYEAGLLGGLDLLDAQQRRVDADLAAAAGQAALAGAVVDQARAAGRPWWDAADHAGSPR